MNSTALRRFVMTWRNFGAEVVLRVLYSKLVGVFNPASALPRASIPRGNLPTLSLFLYTAVHSAAVVRASIGIVRGRDGADWEVCICARVPLAPEMASLLAEAGGTAGIRILTVADAVYVQTAARWTIEQATGTFVALLAPGVLPSARGIAALLSHLRDTADAAVLVGTHNDTARLFLQAKTAFLACAARWPLTPQEQVAAMRQANVPVVYVTEDDA